MGLYHARAVSTITTGTAGTPLWAIRGDTTNRTFIRELRIFNLTAPTTSGNIALTRSTALGTGSLTSVTLMPRDPRNTAADVDAKIVTAWATLAPTVGAASTYEDGFAHGTAIGNGIMPVYDLTAPLTLEEGDSATGEFVFVNAHSIVAGTYVIYVAAEIG